MATGVKRSITYLQGKFETGDVPSENDFADWLASFVHLDTGAYDDYTAVRLATEDTEIYYIKDARTGGLFVKDNAAGADNGFTVIHNALGNSYRRVYDSQSVRMAWNDTPGVFSDISKAHAAVAAGGTIHFENITYAVTTIFQPSKEVYINLNGATLQTPQQYSSVISVGAMSGNTVTVVDGTNFTIGGIVGIANGNASTDIKPYADGAYDAIITNKVGNVITLSRNLAANEATNTLFVSGTIFTVQGYPFHISNGTIDQQRDVATYSYAWQTGSAVVSNNYVDASFMNFIDIRHTAIMMGWGTVTNSTADNFCAFTHVSYSAKASTLDYPKTYIYNNNIKNGGKNYAECGHGEGVFTYSNGVYNVIIEGNTIQEIENSLLSQFSADDDWVTFRNNKCYNAVPLNRRAIYITVGGAFTGTQDKTGIDISNNTLHNVGNIEVYSFSELTGSAVYGINIAENILTNGQLLLVGVQGQVNNNSFLFNDDYDYSITGLSDLTEQYAKAAVVISTSYDLEINNTKILSSQKDSSMIVGLGVKLGDRIRIDGLTIKGFHIGVTTFQTLDSAGKLDGHDIQFNNLDIEVTGGNYSGEAAAICALITRGNSITNSRLSVDLNGEANAWCIMTALDTQYPTSEKVVTTIKDNHLQTNHTYPLTTHASYVRTDRCTIMNNSGFAYNAGVGVENTGMSTGIFAHASANITREFTTLKSNYLWQSDDFELKINLPTYLDFVKVNR